MTRRLEALRAMAEQDVSPQERDIAQAKLGAMGAWPPPPRPPAPPSAAAAPQPDWGSWFSWTNGAAAVDTSTFTAWNNTAGGIYIRIVR